LMLCSEGLVRVTVFGIEVVREDVLAPLPSVPPPPALVKRRSGPQIDRVRQVMPKLFSPDGKVPSGMSVKAVWAMVVDALESDSKAKHLANPSSDVVDAVIKEIGRRGD
jgi:hypothetical protein